MNPRLQRALWIGGSVTAASAIFRATAGDSSDFEQLWVAAQAWRNGLNPYEATGPDAPYLWPWPLLYPMPAVLVAVLFSWWPFWLADPIFVGLGAGLLAYGLMRDNVDDPRLIVFASFAYFWVIRTSQWAPLLTAGALLPWLTPLWACKPTLGLAFLAAYPSRRAVVGIVLLTCASLIAYPEWPWAWREAIASANHMTPPILRPGGFLVLAALYRWRLPEARLLVALACVPQTPTLVECIPLFLIPRTLRKAGLLAGLTFVVDATVILMAPFPSYEAFVQMNGRLIVWLVYLPCTALVLWPSAALALNLGWRQRPRGIAH